MFEILKLNGLVFTLYGSYGYYIIKDLKTNEDRNFHQTFIIKCKAVDKLQDMSAQFSSIPLWTADEHSSR